MNDHKTLDYIDGRRLALMIAQTCGRGWLDAGNVGGCWSPRIEPGKHWAERKCKAVMQQLIEHGLAAIHDGWSGYAIRITPKGYKRFDIDDSTMMDDAEACRRLGKIKTAHWLGFK